MSLNQSYVELQGECYRIAGTRVSLDSIVYAFLEGDSPETISQSFPVLTLEQVYGAIAYYLAHREEIDSHLRLEEADFEEKRRLAREKPQPDAAIKQSINANQVAARIRRELRGREHTDSAMLLREDRDR